VVERLGRPTVWSTVAMVMYAQNQFAEPNDKHMKHKTLSAPCAGKTASDDRLPVSGSLFKTKRSSKTMTTLKIVREASLNCEKNRLPASGESLFGQRTGRIDTNNAFSEPKTRYGW
jgi:hypothetical protein